MTLEETVRRTLNGWVDPTTRDEAAAIIAVAVRKWFDAERQASSRATQAFASDPKKVRLAHETMIEHLISHGVLEHIGWRKNHHRVLLIDEPNEIYETDGELIEQGWEPIYHLREDA